MPTVKDMGSCIFFSPHIWLLQKVLLQIRRQTQRKIFLLKLVYSVFSQASSPLVLKGHLNQNCTDSLPDLSVKC